MTRSLLMLALAALLVGTAVACSARHGGDDERTAPPVTAVPHAAANASGADYPAPPPSGVAAGGAPWAPSPPYPTPVPAPVPVPPPGSGLPPVPPPAPAPPAT